MIAESPLIFTPSGKGFKAHYALNFSSDLVHLIPLFGDVQGAGIEAKTLLVDNTANPNACSLNLRGRVVMVAPYTQQYIDCSGALDVVITGGSATASVSLDVLTYTMPEQTLVKKTLNVGGLPPISVSINDIVYATAKKALSIGSPITSFVDLFNADATNGLLWGFDSSCSNGTVNANSSYHISMSCDSQELWLKTAGGAPSVNYKILGG
jgi:hypothetical protein